MRKMHIKACTNAYAFLFIHESVSALLRERKLYVTSLKSNVFPCPRLNAAGHIMICIEWIACLLHNKRSLHKLHINTDGFCPLLSLLLLWHLEQLSVSLESLILFLVFFEWPDPLNSCSIARPPLHHISLNSEFLQHKNVKYPLSVIRYKIE